MAIEVNSMGTGNGNGAGISRITAMKRFKAGRVGFHLKPLFFGFVYKNCFSQR